MAVLAAIDDPVERLLTVMAGFELTSNPADPVSRLPAGWDQAAARESRDLVGVNGAILLTAKVIGEWFASRALEQRIPTKPIEVPRRGVLGPKTKVHQAWVLPRVIELHINRSDAKHAGDVYALADGQLLMQRKNGFSRNDPPVAGMALTTAAPPAVYTIMGRLIGLDS